MKRKIALTITLFLAITALQAERLVKVSDNAWAKNSVNTTVFRNQSVVTHKNNQYTAFYNERGVMVLASRKLGSKKWNLKETPYKGNVKDAHNVISLGIDGKGFLHVSWDHHGHPLRYAKSIAPGSLELTPMQVMVGDTEQNVTYPEFYSFPNGDLLFAYRDGSSGNGTMVLNRYDVQKGEWRRLQSNLIDGEGKRNAYWQMCVDKKGGVHVSWVWRESYKVETNHDLCYAYSPDGGVSWYHTDRSTPYILPINVKNAQYICRIPQNSELINQTSMTCDDKTYPYIATYWRDRNSNVPQYRLVYFDGAQWQQMQVGNRTHSFSLSGGGSKKIPISRPRLAVHNDRQGDPVIYYIFRDEERGSKVSLAVCKDLQWAKWSVTDLTSFSVNSWEPSYDIKLWAEKKKLHLYVQCTGQGDGEKLEQMDPQPVYILEAK